MDLGPNIILRSQTLTAEVSPFGAELQRLATVDGSELQWDGDPAVWSGRAPVLFPVIGLLEGGRYRLDAESFPMPKHGFARHSAFGVVEQGDDFVVLRLSASDATRPIYPFEFQLDVAFTLEGSALTVAATVSNRGDVAMPASFGFHPALRWPLPFGRARSEHRIVFGRDETAPLRRIGADGLLTPDAHASPIVDRVLVLHDALFTDDALIFDRVSSRSVLYGAESGPQLAVDFPDFDTLGVWTKPGADFICIEPWAGLPDPKGYAGDLRDKPGIFEVASRGSRRLAMTLTWLPDPPRMGEDRAGR